ncbi:MAG: ATP synthase F1 subunit delta [Longimicrobiales bacterium]
MREETVAKNYAETLFELAKKHGQVDAFAEGIEAVARLIDENPNVREFVETPRIAAVEKKRVLEGALRSHVPALLMNFVKLVIDKRRQRLLRPIASAYQDLQDDHAGRTHVDVTVARALQGAEMADVGDRLSRAFGKTVIPHMRVNPEILGGIIVKTGDTIYDGSVRRQIDRMRRTLLGAELPAPAGE